MIRKVAIHWLRFGPYHIARMQAAYRYLKEQNVEAVAVATASKDVDYAWRVSRRDVAYEQVTWFPDKAHQELRPWHVWRRCFASLDQMSPEVVAIAGYSTTSAQALLAWALLRRRPAILMSATKADDAPRSGWREWLKRRVIGRFGAAVCGGRHQRAYLKALGMAEQQIFDGYDVVDNDYFASASRKAVTSPQSYAYLPGLDDRRPFFVSSARFYRRKNLDGLLKAYQRYRTMLQTRFPDVMPRRLILLGDGALQPELERIVHDYQLSDVIFAGFRQIDELPAYYGLADALIHPAFGEPWGLVVNEAMASGIPVLVSERCGCVDDLVIDGHTGFKFDPFNLDQMAALMVRVSADPDLRAALAEGARRHIQAWGPDRFAQNMFSAMTVALRRAG